ncbi:Acireductone dioxygenase, ARD, partial [mine drainage metagenome]
GLFPGTHETSRLLSLPMLTVRQGETVLDAFIGRFTHLKNTLGYQSQDLITLFPDLPGLDGLLQKFVSCHTHSDDEIRYIIEGEGVFGFVLSDQDQVELTMTSGDYINVPAGTEHWFRLTASRRVKAIRYFSSREGWVPVYTGRPVRTFARQPETPAPLKRN